MMGISERIAELGSVEFITNQHVNHTLSDPNEGIDPDNHFCFNMTGNCKYYTEVQYRDSAEMDGKLSLIHFNSRSLYTNFGHIKEYLNHFKTPFTIIAVSETWINEDKGTDFFLDGYNLVKSMYIQSLISTDQYRRVDKGQRHESTDTVQTLC